MIPKAIIYPIREGNEYDCSFELIMSLRSIERYLEDLPVFVLSEKRPPYLTDLVTFIETDDYVDAMRKACDIAEEILWMNDDIFLLKEHTWESFRKWVPHAGIHNRSDGEINKLLRDRSGGKPNEWRVRRGKVMAKLKELGHTVRDFSTHTPYLYDTAKLKIVMEEFDFGHKTPFETAYANYWSQGMRACRRVRRANTRPLPLNCDGYELFNYDDKGATDQCRGFLLGRFSKPSKYEQLGVDISATIEKGNADGLD